MKFVYRLCFVFFQQWWRFSFKILKKKYKVPVSDDQVCFMVKHSNQLCQYWFEPFLIFEIKYFVFKVLFEKRVNVRVRWKKILALHGVYQQGFVYGIHIYIILYKTHIHGLIRHYINTSDSFNSMSGPWSIISSMTC